MNIAREGIPVILMAAAFATGAFVVALARRSWPLWLLAFALSDTASAAGSETSDAASNLFAAVASQAIVGAISPILPVKLDLIAYEPATASSSRALVFGHWITRRLLVLYRNRTEARVDENVNEAEVEYWLGRRVLFEGVAGDRGILGADLLWTRRW